MKKLNIIIRNKDTQLSDRPNLPLRYSRVKMSTVMSHGKNKYPKKIENEEIKKRTIQSKQAWQYHNGSNLIIKDIKYKINKKNILVKLTHKQKMLYNIKLKLYHNGSNCRK